MSDDGADLFESGPEDQGFEVEQSMDLPSLSMNSSYVRSPLPPENYDGDDHLGSETDQSEDGGFDSNEGVESSMIQPMQIVDELEDQEPDHQEDISALVEANDSVLAEQRAAPFCRSGDEVSESENNANRGEGVVMNQLPAAIPRCESPRTSEPVAQQDSVDEKEPMHDNEHNIDHDCASSPDYQADKQTAIDNSNEDTEQSSARLLAQTPIHTELDQLTRVSSEPRPLATEAITTPLECVDTSAKLSPRQSQERQTDIVKTPSPGLLKTPASIPGYTVASLFPVVYEREPSPTTQCQSTQVVSLLNTSVDVQKSGRERGKQQNGRSPASRLAVLQSQLDAAHSALANTARSFKLQLSMTETDNKKLSQRNARLKNQLSVATADLQRANTEMAKLKTENELYAAKLPRLQAELLEETSQVDETQAQSVQTQMVLTQLKARSHVLQTRNLALEAQNNKLTQQLRECTQQLKRKVAALQQQSEKAIKMESDMNELKTTHGHEKLEWKSRMTSALQRFERENNKLEAEWKVKERKELRDAKERAEKATKKRRAADSSVAKLEDQLKHYKHEMSSANDTIQRRVNEVRTLESLLRKAHRTEATLRNDVAACKAKLRTLQEEKRRRMVRPATIPTRRRRLEQQIPIELLLHLSDSSDDEDGNQKSKCCSHCVASAKTTEPESPIYTPVCTKCPELQDQLRQLRNELRRVRALHGAELHAQASVLDALLHQKGNLQ